MRKITNKINPNQDNKFKRFKMLNELLRNKGSNPFRLLAKKNTQTKTKTNNKTIPSEIMTLDNLIGEIPINAEVKSSIQSNSDIPNSEKFDLQNRVDDFFSGKFILLESVLDFNISQNYMYELLKNPVLAVKLMREYSSSQYNLTNTKKSHILEITNKEKFRGLIYPIHTSKDKFMLYAECVLKFSKFENRGRGVFVFDYNSDQTNHTITKCKFYFAMNKKWQNYLLETLLNLGLKNHLQGITNILGQDAKSLATNFTKNKKQIIGQIRDGETKEIYSKEDVMYLQNLFEKNNSF